MLKKFFFNNIYISLLGYVLIYIFYYFVFTMLFSPYGLSIAATTALALAFAINFVRKRDKKRGIGFKEALGINLPRVNKKSLFMLMLMGIGMNFTISGIINLLPERLTKNYAQSYNLLLGGNVYMTLFVMAIITPLLEEIFFRGIFQRKLSERYGAFRGLIASAVIFGIMHFDIVWSTYAAVIGFFMGCLYMYYDSVLPSAAVHCMFNLVSCIFVFLSKYEKLYSLVFGTKLFAAVMLVLGIGIIYRISDKTWLKAFFETGITDVNQEAENE